MHEMNPHHGAIYGRILMQDLERQGIPPAQLLDGIDLDPADLLRDGGTVRFDLLAAMFERAAELTGDDLLGLHRGERRRLQRAGALAYVGLSAPNMRHMLKNTARYSKVFSDAVRINAEALDDCGEIRWFFDVPISVLRRQFVEFGATGTLVALRQLTNRNLAPVSVRFAHPRNYGVEAFDRLFGCHVQFGAGENAMAFRQSDLDLPLLTADEDLLSVLLSHCEDILARKNERGSPLVARTERAIVDRLTDGTARQDIVATDLGMSSRSLSRRLAEEGTSFQKVLDGLRIALAQRYLRHSDLSQSEIAYLLGYSSLSSFSSAYRRQTGQSPGEARRQSRR